MTPCGWSSRSLLSAWHERARRAAALRRQGLPVARPTCTCALHGADAAGTGKAYSCRALRARRATAAGSPPGLEPCALDEFVEVERDLALAVVTQERAEVHRAPAPQAVRLDHKAVRVLRRTRCVLGEQSDLGKQAIRLHDCTPYEPDHLLHHPPARELDRNVSHVGPRPVGPMLRRGAAP